MKITPRSPHVLHIRQLLGLALIGFVLWLAATGGLEVPPAQAAPNDKRHGNPEQRLAHMQKQLNLTPEQVERIRPILKNHAEERRRLRDEFQGRDRRAMRDEMRGLREETERALAAVLTADQMATWQQLREERQQERQKRRSAKPRP